MFLRLRKTGPRLDASCPIWGPAPRPPGIYRFDPNPEARGTSEVGCQLDTPPRSWALSRRSGCFPALPYPPPRPWASLTEDRQVQNLKFATS